jgi:hypothetical protein
MARDKNKSVAYGWTGRWSDGQIGWCVPQFVYNNIREVAYPCPHMPDLKGVKLVKCRITVEVVKDKRGRETRRWWK